MPELSDLDAVEPAILRAQFPSRGQSGEDYDYD
jgi:hypothetical protein